MKIRFFAAALGLAVLLSACLPDLPGPEGQVAITVDFTEPVLVPMDWSITGQPAYRPDPMDLSGEIAALRTELTMLAGEYELRITPPEFVSNDLAFGWVADGPAAELSADFVHDFTLHMQTTHEVTASFRRPHVLQWDYVPSAGGVEPASVSLTNVTARDSDFELAGVILSCATVGNPDPMEFRFSDGAGPVTLTAPPQVIALEYSGELARPVFPAGTPPACDVSLAFDSHNRPVADIYSPPAMVD